MSSKTAQIKENLKPYLAWLETLRTDCIAEYNRRKKIALSIGALALVANLAFDIFILKGEFYTSILTSIGLFIWVHMAKSPYNAEYKNIVIPAVLKSFGKFAYDAKGQINMENIKSADIVPKYTRIRSEDYFYSKLGDIKFEFCELELSIRSGKNTYLEFKGAAILFTLPFKFQAHTTIGLDEGKLSNIIKSKSNSKKTVRLENPEFEKRYEVYSTDQQAARYVLTPAMMERIMALNDLFIEHVSVGKVMSGHKLKSEMIKKAKNNKHSSLQCEFWDNKMLIMIPSTRLLEAPNINKSVYNLEGVRLIYEEITIITSIIKQLKLDYLALRKQAANKFK